MWFCCLGLLNGIYSKLRSCTDQSTGPFKFPEAEVLSIIKVEEIDTEITYPSFYCIPDIWVKQKSCLKRKLQNLLLYMQLLFIFARIYLYNYSKMEKELTEILNFIPATCVGGQVRKLNRIISKKYNDAFSQFGINISQGNILFVVSSKQGILQIEIANRLVLERSTLHRDIKRLIDRKLLMIEKNLGIKSPSVYLTEEGKAFIKSMVPVWKQVQKELHEILGKELIENVSIINAELLKQ